MAEQDSTPRFTEADGRQLAGDLLRDLEKWLVQVDGRVGAELQDGKDEPDMREVLLGEEPEILRRYLDVIRNKKCAELERGFLCVISHALASSLDTDDYEDHIEPEPGRKYEM